MDSTFPPIFKIHWNNLKGLRILKPKKKKKKKKEPTNNLVFFGSSNIFLATKKKKLTERLIICEKELSCRCLADREPEEQRSSHN